MQVVGKNNELVDLADSPLAGNVRIFTDYDPEWEIEPSALNMLEKIGELRNILLFGGALRFVAGTVISSSAWEGHHIKMVRQYPRLSPDIALQTIAEATAFQPGSECE